MSTSHKAALREERERERARARASRRVAKLPIVSLLRWGIIEITGKGRPRAARWEEKRPGIRRGGMKMTLSSFPPSPRSHHISLSLSPCAESTLRSFVDISLSPATG